MKKIYITMVLASISMAGMAQRNTNAYTFGSPKKLGPATQQSHYKPAATSNDQTKALNIVWTEDFSGGTLPLETGNGQYVAGGISAAYWTIGTGAHPLSAFGWTHAMTADHLTWDSYNPNSSEPGGFATTAVSGEIVSPTISYTGVTNSIGMRFITEAMYCCNFQELPFQVCVSTNNGVTWSDTITMDFGVDRNEATEDIAHPLIHTVNFDAYVPAGPQSQFKFKLIWDGIAQDPNTQRNTHYFWLLDNLEIYEIPNNNIGITAGYHHDVFNDWEYSMVASSQTREMIPAAIVENMGMQAQTFDLSATVSDGSGVVATATPVSVTLAPGQIDTVAIPTGYTPATIGETYYATLSVPSDDDNTNNTWVTSTLDVTASVTGHDYYSGGSFGWSPTGSNSALADAPHGWGTIIVPAANDVIEGLDVMFETGTTDNYLYAAQVQQIDPSGIGDWIQDPLLLLGQSLITLTPADIGTEITIPFSTPISVTAGEAYIIEIQKIDGTSGAGFYIGSSENNGEDDDFSTVGYGEYGASPGVTYFNGWGWSPYIRANNNVLGVDELGLEGVSVYPNPSNGIVNITNNKANDLTITVTDVAGNFVTSQSTSTAAKLDLGTVGTGMYLIKVESANGSIVERVIIK